MSVYAAAGVFFLLQLLIISLLFSAKRPFKNHHYINMYLLLINGNLLSKKNYDYVISVEKLIGVFSPKPIIIQLPTVVPFTILPYKIFTQEKSGAQPRDPLSRISSQNAIGQNCKRDFCQKQDYNLINGSQIPIRMWLSFVIK